ncbi:MAG: sulfurase [Sphingomonas bacterium]|nr:sulfurase [Sphingomonas bacterium]
MSDSVGRVAGLWRFPVKSMAGEPLDAVALGWRGIAGDRQYGFHHAGSLSRFPWFTARDLSEMVRYRAAFRDPDDPRNAPVEVTTPDGERFRLDAPELKARLAEAAGGPLELMQSGRGVFDYAPVSIVSTATHAALDAARGAHVDPRRFRINIVIDSTMRENAWAERTLAFGEGEEGPRLSLQEPIERCVVVTIDPDTGVRSPGIMKTVARGFDNRIGIYASAARTGIIRVGDVVRLL